MAPRASLREIANVKLWETPRHLPLCGVTPLVFLSFFGWSEVGVSGEGELLVRSDSDCCWDVENEIKEMHRNVKMVGAFEVEGTLGTADSRAATGLQQFINLPRHLAYGPN